MAAKFLRLRKLFALFLLSWPVAAQPPEGLIAPPFFRSERVLQAWADRPALLAPGMLVSIYGQNLGPAASCIGKPDPDARDKPVRAGHTLVELLRYPTDLCDTRVLVGGIPAGLLYVHRDQINLKVPMDAPPEGLVEFQVIHRGRKGAAVPVGFGKEPVLLTVPQPVYVNMPVWIEVRLPQPRHGGIRYPFDIRPNRFGGHSFEVRREGKLLAPITPHVVLPSVGGGGPGSFLGLPREPAVKGRVPLHLQFRFDRPGNYEVRYTSRAGFAGSGEVIDESAWTAFEVRPFDGEKRLAWLAALRASAPRDAVELLSDFLPSVLALPDQHVLPVLLEYLHHPDGLVQRFACEALAIYYSPETLAEAIPERIKTRGPTGPLAYLLSWRRDLFQPKAAELVRDLVPHLRSRTPDVSGSAAQALLFLREHYDWRGAPAIPARIDSAVLDAAVHIVSLDSREAVWPLTLYLGAMKTPAAKELLWKLAERPDVREQALICIAQASDANDLARLAAFLERPDPRDAHGSGVSGLPYQLRRVHGRASIPYLLQILSVSGQAWVRAACAKELVQAGEPAGFAFFADAIGQNRFYRPEMVNWLKGQFQELQQKSEDEVLAFLRARVGKSGGRN